jgi:hypothetical protein
MCYSLWLQLCLIFETEKSIIFSSGGTFYLLFCLLLGEANHSIHFLENPVFLYFDNLLQYKSQFFSSVVCPRGTPYVFTIFPMMHHCVSIWTYLYLIFETDIYNLFLWCNILEKWWNGWTFGFYIYIDIVSGEM